MKRTLFAVVLFGVLLPFVIGCGEKLPPDLPKLYPTTLTITQDGKPLEVANVMLLPKDTNSRWAAAGVTSSAGTVEFFTEGRYRGVPAGDYQVTVSKVYTEPGKYFGRERPADKDRMTWDNLVASEKGKIKSYHLVDLVYQSRRTTPLELTVSPDQPNDQTIDVGRACRILMR